MRGYFENSPDDLTDISERLIFDPDNIYDIGAAATGRPKTIYVGTSVVSPTYLVSAAGSLAAPSFSASAQTGTDTAGLSVVVGGGLGTGAGAGGVLTLATPTTLGTGTTAQTRVARVTISQGAVTTDACTVAMAATLAVRQQGGVAGTDEVKIFHDGTNGFVQQQSGKLFLGTFGNIVFASSADTGGSPEGAWITSGGFSMRAAFSYGWSATSDPEGTQDLCLYRDAAGTLAQRNSTNAQTFRVYTTYTDGSNYEAFQISTAAGTVTLAPITAGSGTDDISLVLTPTGTGRVVANGWLQNAAAVSRVTGDVTNATTTMAAITGLSATLVAGRKYIGSVTLKCDDSVAAEGIKFDFDGGTATMTSFWAYGVISAGGVAVEGTVSSSSLAGDINWTTITSTTFITLAFSLVCNAGGTFIPQFAQNSHSSGTATVSLGSFMFMEDVP